MIRVERLDLATSQFEAILRPVRSDLSSVTSVSRQLEVTGGTEMRERLEALGELPVGAAVVTPAQGMGCSFVIHVAIEAPDEPISADTVRRGLQNGLRRAVDLGVESLALPPLGTGAGNLDAESSANVMIPLIREHLSSSQHPRELVIAVSTAYEHEAFERVVEVGWDEAEGAIGEETE